MSLAQPGAISERIRYRDKVRRVFPQLPGGLRAGDLTAGTWAIELTRMDAPSYCATVLERAQTWLRVEWADALGAMLEITGSDPGTAQAWNGSLFAFPIRHPTIAARTIAVRWVVVAQGEDSADTVRPLGEISSLAGAPANTVPHCVAAVPDWSDNRRGFHRSVDREQHVVTVAPAVLRMFAVLTVTAEAPGVVVAQVEVGGRLQGVIVQQGPLAAGTRAAVVRS